MKRIALACLLVATPGFSADWNIRPWDEIMELDEVQTRLVGQDVLFMDGSIASYGSDGRYIYTYISGRKFEGDYQIRDDGSVCIDFDEGQKRCDFYVLHGERLVLIAETGRRFPVAP